MRGVLAAYHAGSAMAFIIDHELIYTARRARKKLRCHEQRPSYTAGTKQKAQDRSEETGRKQLEFPTKCSSLLLKKNFQEGIHPWHEG